MHCGVGDEGEGVEGQELCGLAQGRPSGLQEVSEVCDSLIEIPSLLLQQISKAAHYHWMRITIDAHTESLTQSSSYQIMDSLHYTSWEQNTERGGAIYWLKRTGT